MGVKYYPLVFKNEFRSETVDFPLYNVQDKCQVEIDFESSETVLASTGQPITLNATDGYLGEGWVADPSNRFANFKIGDTIRIGDYVPPTGLIGDYTIIDKQSNGAIQLDSPIYGLDPGNPGDVVADYESVQSIFSITKPITGLKFFYNFIENSEAVNFISKVDGSEQVVEIDGIDASDTTPATFIPLGPVTWQIGNATIEGVEIVDTYYYASRFKIKLTTYLMPFIDDIVTNNPLTGVVPTWFQALKCLKFVAKIQAFYILSDPNRKQEGIKSDLMGNTGYYNENFNNSPSGYFIDSVVYKKADNVTVKPSLELTTDDQYVEITVKSTSGTFSNNNTKFRINHIKAPYDSDERSGNGRYLQVNFCMDQAVQTLGSASIDGEFFGLPGIFKGCLKSITGQFVNAQTMVVKFRVDYTSNMLAILQESEIPYFQLSVSVQDHTKDTDSSDRVNLVADLSEYYIDTSDPEMIGIETKFLEHWENDPETEGLPYGSSINVLPTDEITAYTRFFIDRNGRETDDIKIQSIQMRIKAQNILTLEEFNLDPVSPINMSAILPGPDGSQYINSASLRPFHIPTTEIRSQIKAKRRADLDDSGLVYYEVYFPFIVRWEYWVAITANMDFFDPSQPNNGFNQFWDHYQVSNWKLYYEISITALKNGTLQGYSLKSQLNSFGWDESSTWEPDSIKTYDVDTGDELLDPAIPRKYILGYKNTRVEALFENNFGAVDLDNTVVFFHIGRWETDTVTGVRRFSSEHVMTSDTYFKSVDTSNKIKLTAPAVDTIKAEALIDFTQLPYAERFAIYVVLKTKPTPDQTFFKEKESGEIKQLENGQNKILD